MDSFTKNEEKDNYYQDVAFDYYSTRMALCGSDGYIKFLKKNDKETFTSYDLLEAHEKSSVWRITWAHPEFGLLLASCGSDRFVKVWQEKTDEQKTNWICRAKISEFSDTLIEDIAFCPKSHGLKLACVLYNGKLKIYEPSEYSNYHNWTKIYSKDISIVGCSSIFWNPSIYDLPSFIIGCYYDPKKNNLKELLQIYVYHEQKRDYLNVENLYTENSHKNSIIDVEWAPRLGRSFHLIATCSVDRKLIIWKLKMRPETVEKEEETFEEKISIKFEEIFQIETATEILRLSWNISGTLLSCIEASGKSHVFQKKSEKTFEEIFVDA